MAAVENANVKASSQPSYGSVAANPAGDQANTDYQPLVRRESGGMDSERVKAILKLCGLILYFIVFSVTELAIGIAYNDSCAAQKNLTTYIIVFGIILPIVFIAWMILRRMDFPNIFYSWSQVDEGNRTTVRLVQLLTGIVALFLIIWYILGNVWVHGMTMCNLDGNDPEDCFIAIDSFKDTDRYCDLVVYDFAYWDTILRGPAFVILIFVYLCW